MPIITPTTQPLHWIVSEASVIIGAGITLIGEATIAALTLTSATEENDLLDALITAGVSAPSMPAMGNEVVEGEIYTYDGVLYMVRITHLRTEHDPATIPNLFWHYQVDTGEALEWTVGEQVYIGTKRIYDGVLYQCLQAHQTNPAIYPTAPGILGLLWGVVATTPEWAVGVAYVGDNIAGAGNGDAVIYLGSDYRCLQSHTSIQTWNPVATLNVLWVAI
jgi:hypothetical protein